MIGAVKPSQPLKVKETRGKMAFSWPIRLPLAEAEVFEANQDMKVTRRGLLKGFVGLLAAAAAVIGAPAVWIYRTKTYSGPVSDHFDGRHFFDPDGVPPKSLGEVLRWQFGPGRQRQAWPVWAPSPHADTPPARVTGEKVRLSFVGHASWLI
jgi:hypothetical protein